MFGEDLFPMRPAPLVPAPKVTAEAWTFKPVALGEFGVSGEPETAGPAQETNSGPKILEALNELERSFATSPPDPIQESGTSSIRSCS